MVDNLVEKENFQPSVKVLMQPDGGQRHFQIFPMLESPDVEGLQVGPHQIPFQITISNTRRYRGASRVRLTFWGPNTTNLGEHLVDISDIWDTITSKLSVYDDGSGVLAEIKGNKSILV